MLEQYDWTSSLKTAQGHLNLEAKTHLQVAAVALSACPVSIKFTGERGTLKCDVSGCIQ